MDPAIEMTRKHLPRDWILAIALTLVGATSVRSQHDLRLNEIEPRGSVQWIELHNHGQDRIVSLKEYSIEVSDINGDNRATGLLPDVSVEVNGFFVVYFEGFCPEQVDNSLSECVPFTLRSLCLVAMNENGGRVRLLHGTTEMENVRYSPLPGGSSFGRRESDSEWCILQARTPGAPNLECLPDAEVRLNEISMQDPRGACSFPPDCPDVVEIYYTGDGTIDLREFRLSDLSNNEYSFEDAGINGDDLPNPILGDGHRRAVVLLKDVLRNPQWPREYFLAPFGLSSAGDTLILEHVEQDQHRWDSIAIPRLDDTTCLARTPDGGPWRFVSPCTISLPNKAEGGNASPVVAVFDRFPLRVVPRQDPGHDSEPIEIFARVEDSNDDVESVHLIVSPGVFFNQGLSILMQPGRAVTCIQSLRRELGVFVGSFERPTMERFAITGEGVVVVMVKAVDRAGNKSFSEPHEIFVQDPEWSDPNRLHELRVNEVAADERDLATGDWIEVFNPTDSIIQLGGVYVTDNILELHQRQLQPFRILPEGHPAGGEAAGYVLIWADGTNLVDQNREQHLPFQLNDCRDEVILVHPDGKHVIDVVSFHEEHLGLTLGRFPDGEETGETTGVLSIMAPTPRAKNQLIACVDLQPTGECLHPVINEVMADNWDSTADEGGEHGDWVEIFNPADRAVSLQGWSLKDSGSGEPWFFPDGVQILPGCFLLVWCDNDEYCENNIQTGTECSDDPIGELHTNFEISREFDSVQLVNDQGTAVDCVTIRFQARDVSAGRFPDGAPHPSLLAPTPGAHNIQHPHLKALECEATEAKLLEHGIPFTAAPCRGQGPVNVCGQFLRGDADSNCGINIADAIVLLSSLFQGGSEPTCADAADANDDGTVNLSDPVFVLNYLFTGGSKPNAPGPETPGPDPTDDDLSCERGGCD